MIYKYDCCVVNRKRKQWIKQVYWRRGIDFKGRKLYCLFDNIIIKTNGSSFSYYYNIITKEKTLLQKIKDWIKK